MALGGVFRALTPALPETFPPLSPLRLARSRLLDRQVGVEGVTVGRSAESSHSTAGKIETLEAAG